MSQTHEQARDAVTVPEMDTAPIAAWVRSMRDLMLDEGVSEWDHDQRERMRPGLDFLLEIARDDHREAEEDFDDTVVLLTCTDYSKLSDRYQGRRTPHHLQESADREREPARTSVSARLTELVAVAQALGIEADEFMLLASKATGTNVIPFRSRPH